MSARARWLAALLAATAAAPACGPGEAPGEVSTVVLLTIDTWRRDATGFLGAMVPSPTPFLDRVAADGLVAADAVAPVPLTGPSHWSMMTGRWPWRDGVRVNGDFAADREIPTLARVLRERGWITAAFVSAAVLDGRFGFEDGFDVYDDGFTVGGGAQDLEFVERRGDATVEAARKWLERQEPGAPVFLWVHLFDPHFPYDSPDGPLPGHRGDYLGEVAYADRQAEHLAECLAALGRALADSVWVVLADHGEGLGDHGERTHGLLLHGATTRIPLIVAGGRTASGVYPSPASTVDVMPTVLDALGVDGPPCDGVSLLAGAGDPEREVPLESTLAADSHGLANVIGLRTRRWLWESSPADHLWEVTSDPQEAHDLAETRGDVVTDLAERRQRFEDDSVISTETADEQTLERLAALGYLRSGAVAGGGDVRAFALEGDESFDRLMSLQRAGRYAEAELLVLRLTESFPDSPLCWLEAGFVAVGLDDLPRAERRFRRAARLAPGRTKARLNLGNTLWLQGRPEEAEKEYREVLRTDPGDLFALYNLGALLWEQGSREQATEPWLAFVERYPADPRVEQVRGLLGVPEQDAGR